MPQRPSILHRLTTRQIVVIAIALLASAASYIDHARRNLRSPNVPTSQSAPAVDDRSRFDRRAGTVTNVVDGDTVDVALGDRETVRVRLLGIDAPDDTSTDLGAKAAAYLSARSKDKPITLRLDELSWPRDADGRLVAYVYLADSEMLNDSIIRDGWAFVHRAEPCDFSGQFEVSENAARAAKRGLWRTITVEHMPTWRQRWMADRGLK